MGQVAGDRDQLRLDAFDQRLEAALDLRFLGASRVQV
jgi:hypothetical protein